MNGNKAVYLATLEIRNNPTAIDLAYFTYELAIFLGFTPCNYDYKYYDNRALTLTRFLEESHITVDTYPENSILELTVVSCKYIDTLGMQSFCQKFNLNLLYCNLISKQANNKWLLS